MKPRPSRTTSQIVVSRSFSFESAVSTWISSTSETACQSGPDDKATVTVARQGKILAKAAVPHVAVEAGQEAPPLVFAREGNAVWCVRGEKELFSDVALGVDNRDRIALIGVNGSGKSTFLKAISGLEPADTGGVTMRQGLRIGDTRA